MSDDIKKTDGAKGDLISEKEKAAKIKKSKSDKTGKKKTEKHNKPSKVNPFKKFWIAILRFFKNTKGEVKKIIWPGRQMIIKSTGVVIAAILVIGAGVWIIDYALSGGLGLVRKAAEKSDTTTSDVSDTTQQTDLTDSAFADTTEDNAEDSTETTESTTAD